MTEKATHDLRQVMFNRKFWHTVLVTDPVQHSWKRGIMHEDITIELEFEEEFSSVGPIGEESRHIGQLSARFLYKLTSASSTNSMQLDTLVFHDEFTEQFLDDFISMVKRVIGS